MNDTITLSLSKEEAITLQCLLFKVGGNDVTTYRKHTQRISNTLGSEGVVPKYREPSRRFNSSVTAYPIPQPKSVKEMSVAEIEEALGYSVKIVKE